jgi:hypothetical protein
MGAEGSLDLRHPAMNLVQGPENFHWWPVEILNKRSFVLNKRLKFLWQLQK